jgi:hypothetical protein
LPVARDRTLTEPNASVIFAQGDVPANAHPQGIAVVTSARRGRGERSRFFSEDLIEEDS